IANSAGGISAISAAAQQIVVQTGASIDMTQAAGGAGSLALTADDFVLVDSGASLKAKDGSIALTANEGATPAAGHFIGINVDNAIVETTGAGAILLQGRAGNTPTANQNIGVFIGDGSTIQSAGTGAVTITGTGGQGTDSNDGVDVDGSGSLVTSVTG